MKYSVALCLLALVIIQQCMSTHIHYRGEKDYKDHDEDTHMSHEGCDHPGHNHKHDHDHKEEDHSDYHQFGKHVGHNAEDIAARIRHQIHNNTGHAKTRSHEP